MDLHRLLRTIDATKPLRRVKLRIKKQRSQAEPRCGYRLQRLTKHRRSVISVQKLWRQRILWLLFGVIFGAIKWQLTVCVYLHILIGYIIPRQIQRVHSLIFFSSSLRKLAFRKKKFEILVLVYSQYCKASRNMIFSWRLVATITFRNWAK